MRKSRGNSSFYIAVAGIFMLLICRSWLSDGMFMDGTMYAVLSRNLAIGAGLFWKPHFSATLFPVFMEHPPLAFGLEGLLFMIFGDTRYVERFYSLMTIVITAMVMVMIWKKLLKGSSTGWLPVQFWILMPTVSWASVNNMLENTLNIFLCLSVLFYLKGLKSNRILYACAAGLMLSLGFMTKGLVAFAPLAFPFFIWLFLRKCKFLPMVADTLLMLFSSLLPLALFFLIPCSKEYMSTYLEMALSKIIEGDTSSSRFYIIYRLLMELLPSLGIIVVFMFFYWKSKLSFNNYSSGLRTGAAFFSLGLASVLPIILTKDQSAYFLLSSFPFFALALGMIMNPFIENALSRINYNSGGYAFFKYSGMVSLAVSILLSVYFSGDTKRDRNKLQDMRVITDCLKENSTLNILPEMSTDWPLYAYYERYKKVSLDPDMSNRHEYLLITSTLFTDSLNKEFERLDLNTEEYELLRRKIAYPGK